MSEQASKDILDEIAGNAQLPGKEDELVSKIDIIYEPWKDERPKDGQVVKINYILTLADGTLIDSSRGRGAPFEFVLGNTNVIEGLNVAVRTFGRGERSKVNIPSSYAYGFDGLSPLIPPESCLICDIELVDFEDRKPLWNKQLVYTT